MRDYYFRSLSCRVMFGSQCSSNCCLCKLERALPTPCMWGTEFFKGREEKTLASSKQPAMSCVGTTGTQPSGEQGRSWCVLSGTSELCRWHLFEESLSDMLVPSPAVLCSCCLISCCTLSRTKHSRGSTSAFRADVLQRTCTIKTSLLRITFRLSLMLCHEKGKKIPEGEEH